MAAIRNFLMLAIFFERPYSGTIMTAALVLLFLPLLKPMLNLLRRNAI